MLAVAAEWFVIVVGIGAYADPIHPTGVRLHLNLAIVTVVESQ